MRAGTKVFKFVKGEQQTPLIKICCIADKKEADLAVKNGANALGFVSKMPSGIGVISEERIIDIVSSITDPTVLTFLLTSLTDVDEIIKQHEKIKTNTIQLCDALTKGTLKELKERLPAHVNLVQVIHIISENSYKEAIEASKFVDALLLDSGNPNATTKELGGTGRVHNWEISKKIVQDASIPTWLAGGLNPENIQKARETVKPFGFDLCSGVRTGDSLDEEKLKNFIQNALH
eukprot:TRINITY_DN5291_c0_g2_i1.p1 TRINITY_DN5291_c0_g2~~TRINITY_DN5291_c0_g2_i1.p1  ORF type:complete len:234 (+),score=50.99 TRINITY_DN5291_c0_g2_i1:55-756(+)